MSCSKHSHNRDNAEQKNIPSQPLPVISVNGVLIEEESLATELQYHQNPVFENVVQQAGQALVIKQLLISKAVEDGIDVNQDNQEASVQQLLSDKVNSNNPTEEDCVRYFENNPSKFTTLPLMEIEHILLPAAKDDLPARDVGIKNAKNIIEQLQKNPMQFPALAKEYSACPSKETGGSLGQISKGQTVPEFERQLATLSLGLAKSPIESRYGFHVVNITRKIEGKPLEYNMVADKVKGYLTHRASHLAIQAYIQELVESSNIEGITMKFQEENIHI